MVKRNPFIDDDNLSELSSLTHLLERNDNDDNDETPCRLTWLSSYMYISTIGNYCMTGSRYHDEYYKTI